MRMGLNRDARKCMCTRPATEKRDRDRVVAEKRREGKGVVECSRQAVAGIPDQYSHRRRFSGGSSGGPALSLSLLLFFTSSHFPFLRLLLLLLLQGIRIEDPSSSISSISSVYRHLSGIFAFNFLFHQVLIDIERDIYISMHRVHLSLLVEEHRKLCGKGVTIASRFQDRMQRRRVSLRNSH